MFPLTMLSCAILFSAVILDRSYFTLIKTTTSDLNRIFKSSGLGWDQCRYSVSMWKDSKRTWLSALRSKAINIGKPV